MNRDILKTEYRLSSTFLVHGIIDGYKKQGTCFAISENKLLTAFHVVKGIDKPQLSFTTDQFLEGISIDLLLITFDENLDIAILSCGDEKLTEHLKVNTNRAKLHQPVKICGYPSEKAGKHAIMDTVITNTYDDIKLVSHSFEVNQVKTIENYKGMSGSPILANNHVIGFLIVQQGGAALYALSIHDVVTRLPKIASHFTVGTTPTLNHVLFNHYKLDHEPYYVERCQDREFVKSLQFANVWVYGKSGVGKTAMINRNLKINAVDYCYCDFSPVVIKNDQDVLDEILNCLEERLGVSRDSQEKNVIKAINGVLTLSKVSKVVVVIDELGVGEEQLLKNIASSLMRLVSYVTHNYVEDGLKFAISTINSPIDLLQRVAKARDYFQFIECDSWAQNLEQLFELLASNLDLNIGDAKLYILESSAQSPRILKSMLRNIILLENYNSEAIEGAITKTLSEVIA